MDEASRAAFYTHDNKYVDAMLQRSSPRRSRSPEMPARAAAPGDGAPGSVDPALIKMSNQHTKLGQARSEVPASTKQNEQDNTHAAPVCAP